ncbi:MAG: hypothetical protein JWO85_2733 [Candidatus Eremiobacteraeota bacterium]|nr:hypothetical protein [Candidatus Eremiobacteraeota bacterium]
MTGAVAAAYAARLPTALWYSTKRTAHGETFSHRSVRLGNDTREIDDAGPFHTEHGRSDGQAWHENDNGQVVLDSTLRGPLIRFPKFAKATATRIHDPIDGYRVESVDSTGTVREYVQTATWNVVRRERVASNGTVTVVYDGLIPGRDATEGPSNANASVRSLAHVPGATPYEPASIGESDVAMPAPRRALVEFPQGEHRVVLPTSFLGRTVMVRVMIAGRGLDFTLDTGTSGIMLDSTVARELGLTSHLPGVTFSAGAVPTAKAIVPEMHVGSLAMHDVAVLLVPLEWREGPGVKSVGLLGFDFLAELGVKIDYEHKRVTVQPGNEYTPPFDPAAIPLDVRVSGGVPSITAAVNGAVGNRWVVDTGNPGAFMILDSFAQLHPDAIRDEGKGRAQPVEFLGVGGVFQTRAYQIQSLRMGKLDLRNAIGFRVTAPGSFPGTDGFIGAAFLSLFTVDLDYGNSRVYLTPNSAGRASIEPTRP